MISLKAFSSMLTGLAAGATLGVLFAPEKGAVSREKIYRKGDRLVNELEDKITELKKTSDKYLEKTQNTVEEAVDRGKDKAEQTMTGIAEKGKQKAEKAKDQAEKVQATSERKAKST